MRQRWQIRGQKGGSLLWEGLSPAPKNEVVQGVLTSKVRARGDEEPHHSKETAPFSPSCDAGLGCWTRDSVSGTVCKARMGSALRGACQSAFIS